MKKFTKLFTLVLLLSISACSSNKTAKLEEMSNIDGYSETEEANTEATNNDEISSEELENYEPDADANIAFMTDVVNIVFFDFDSSELNETARQTLQDQAAWLEINPTTKIMLEGHCDERGTREYNLALGARRAAKTQAYLVALGIDESRIKTISYGKERPMILDSSEKAWGKNRRAVTILY
ncbi:MAG: peptidoglycan-associated lipoprotein Pal [Alphaproteobacteria bacterium]|jgi:peptidoglycan-associated lipoprotein|nr:peptidoglycan-associated lipoprotein Pal [Alphaproteobacteria bacterium]MCV6598892.1 peptidoglycan-associated lipoprotein Pal [Alphaproteobacteria bacterium]